MTEVDLLTLQGSLKESNKPYDLADVELDLLVLLHLEFRFLNQLRAYSSLACDKQMPCIVAGDVEVFPPPPRRIHSRFH